MTSAFDGLFSLQRSFADVDDLIAEARHWNLDFRQLERGEFSGELLQFASHGVQIAEARFRRTLQQAGAPPEDLRTIAVPARADLDLVWRGHQIDGNSLMLFPRGGELSSVSYPNFHVYTCSFSESLLDSISESLQMGSYRAVADSVEAIRCNPSHMQTLRRCLDDVCTAVRSGSSRLTSEHLADQLTTRLPVAIISSIADARGQCRPATTAKRETALARALEFFEASVRQDVSIRDVVRAVGVSPRTLEYTFAERFGVTPKEYLQVMRFRGVKTELRQACSQDTRVADVAAQWGFWHLGQFAADYRQRFGELPSETLRS